ncbi:MAG: sulfotransferase, partial [Gemmatimonadota bacterium]|nr:sulfotransferase [Gemmatimonadota bacterium]
MAAPKRDTKSGRQALLVLGMHRSGTSAVSGVLTHLGAQAPRTLMPPTKDNPRGYWESVELMRLHDQVLSSAGSRWNDWGEFNPEWIDSSLARDLSRLLVESISKEYDRAPLFVVKDPRICRFVPLWLVALRGARITPKVIIPVRHPLDVARSLELRDHFGRSRSMLLWLRHVLDAEASSRSVARTFVLYENLLDDWRAQARKIATQLDLVWPKWSGDTEAKIEDFLTEELRHHAARNARIPGDGKLSEWIGTVYRILLEADEKPLDQAALAVLDAIRDEFNQTSGMYAAVVREHQTRVEGLHAEMKSQLSKKTLEYDGLATKQRELLQEVAAGEKALAERVDEVKTLSGSLEAGSAERAEILRQQELDDARRELLEETKAQLAQSTAEALNLKLGATHEALAQAERMLEEQRALAHGAVARLKSCEEEYSRSTADLERQVRDHALQLQASKAEHSEAEDRLKERVESLTTELTDGQGELVRVKAQLEALGQQFQASKAEQSEAEDRFKARLESLTTELTDGQGELVRVKTQLEALGQQ